MNTPEFILQALFFVVNSLALCFLVWFVCRIINRMGKRLDETIKFMRWVKSRHDTPPHLNMLYHILFLCIQQEKYEDADKIKKMIDEELKDLNKRK